MPRLPIKLIFFGAVTVVIIAAVFFGYDFVLKAVLQTHENFVNRPHPSPTRIYAKGENGSPVLLATLYGKKLIERRDVALSQISPWVIHAVLLAEDQHFYDHLGIDPFAVVRALLANQRAGRVVEGGSTITQQLVKNVFVGHDRTWSRKLREAWISFLLELKLSKNDILEAYLNEVYWGQVGPMSIVGIESASRYYFSKSAADLTLAQASMLAVMIKSPGAYSPFINPDRALVRRNELLERFKQKGFLMKAEYTQALLTPLPIPSGRPISQAVDFVSFVGFHLMEDYATSAPASQGWDVMTSLDLHLQQVAEDSLEKHLSRYDKKDDTTFEGVVLSMEPQTGKILAYVGGRANHLGDFDRIRQARRQPGSAFKPFIYMAALDPSSYLSTFTLATRIPDEPITIDLDPLSSQDMGRQKTRAFSLWTPENSGHVSHGEVSVRRALEQSFNQATVWLGNQMDLRSLLRKIKQAGIEGPLPEVPSVLLGAGEVTPLELAQAYTIFPNQGRKTLLNPILEVRDSRGEIVPPKSKEDDVAIISEDLAYLMNRALEGVVKRGTAASASRLGFHRIAAGKTGTTSGKRDAWFVGYTPKVLTLVWLGRDDNKPIGLTGAQGALPIWVDVMKETSDVVTDRKALGTGGADPDFVPSPQVVKIPIDAKTGYLANPACGGSYVEYFIAGTEPRDSCVDWLPWEEKLLLEEKLIEDSTLQEDLEPLLPDE